MHKSVSKEKWWNSITAEWTNVYHCWMYKSVSQTDVKTWDVACQLFFSHTRPDWLVDGGPTMHCGATFCTDAISIAMHCKWRKAEFYTSILSLRCIWGIRVENATQQSNSQINSDMRPDLRSDMGSDVRSSLQMEENWILKAFSFRCIWDCDSSQLHSLTLIWDLVWDFIWSWVFKLQHNEQNQIKMLWVSDS